MSGFDPGFSSVRTQGIFSNEARVARMLEVESALAGAQAEVGLIPAEGAAAIAAVCALLPSEPEIIIRAGWQMGTVVVPLLEWVRRRLDVDQARWLHRGATTQDIVDTALVLQMRDGIDAIVQSLDAIVARVKALMESDGTIQVLGRTFLQCAVPMAIGVRFAGWLAGFEAGRERLLGCRAALPLQLGGPVGDAAKSPEIGSAVAIGLGRALRLRVPSRAWHTDRTPVVDVIGALDRAVTAAAKCAWDVVLLAQTEISEVSVRAGTSSAMPHKRNPADAMQALAAAEAFRGVASIVLRSPPPMLERGLGGWHAEAFAVPMSFHTAAAAMEATREGLDHLQVCKTNAS